MKASSLLWQENRTTHRRKTPLSLLPEGLPAVLLALKTTFVVCISTSSPVSETLHGQSTAGVHEIQRYGLLLASALKSRSEPLILPGFMLQYQILGSQNKLNLERKKIGKKGENRRYFRSLISTFLCHKMSVLWKHEVKLRCLRNLVSPSYFC